MTGEPVDKLFAALDAEVAARLRNPTNVLHLRTLCSSLAADPSRRPIAFVGAGFSHPLPTWLPLLRQLGEEALRRDLSDPEALERIYLRAQDDPLGAARELFDLFGDDGEVRGLLQAKYQLPGNRPTESHRLAMHIPFRGFVTTNYDLGLSHAWMEEYWRPGELLDAYTYDSIDRLQEWRDRDHFHADRPPILHLHGSVSEPLTMVLDQTAYDLVYGHGPDSPDNPLFRQVLSDLWLKETLVLLGFSGADPMVRLLAQEAKKLKWAGSKRRHIAILPLPPDRAGEAQQIRRQFSGDFSADVIFFDPTAVDPDGQPFGDLRTLLRALGTCFPTEPERRRRDQALSAIDAHRAKAAAHHRIWLNEMVGQGAEDCFRDPVGDVFWVPTIISIADADPNKRTDRPSSTTTEGTLARAVELPEAAPAPADAKPDADPATPSARSKQIIGLLYGEGGAGKSALSRLLALGMTDGTAKGTDLERVTSVLDPQISSRDLPVVINLKPHAAEFLDAGDDIGAAIRRCAADWGPATAAMVDTPQFAERGLLIIDGLETLLWLDSRRRSRCHDPDDQAYADSRAVIDKIKKIWPTVPILITSRPVAKSMQERGAIADVGYEIAPLDLEDLCAIACVHLHGHRDAVPPPGDHRLRSLSTSPEFQSLASTPMWASIAVGIIEAFTDGRGPTRERMMSRHFDKLLKRGLVADEDPPFANEELRELVKKIAYKLTESGKSLTQGELLACGAGLGAASTRAAAAWLAERTELLSIEPDGGVSIEQDVYREWYAAEELPTRSSEIDLVALAAADQWREPVKYAAARLLPNDTERTILQLHDAGRLELAIGAFVEASEEVRAALFPELRARFDKTPPKTMPERLALIRTLASRSSPAARCLLFDLALPVRAIPLAASIDNYLSYEWNEPSPIDEAAQRLHERLVSSDHLSAISSIADPAQLIFTFSDGGARGGVWEMASINVGFEKLEPESKLAFLDLITFVTEPGNQSIARALLKAAEEQEGLGEELRLLAAGTFLRGQLPGEKPSSATAAETLEADLRTVLRVLQAVGPEPAPAFVVGATNALLTALSALGGRSTLRKEVAGLRRQASRVFASRLAEFYRRSGRPDGLWTASTFPLDSQLPPPPTLDEGLQRLEEAIARAALSPPRASKTGPWKQRVIADAYVAAHGDVIHKLRAKDTTGRRAYYLVLVDKPFERQFLAMIEGDGTLDLEEYGKVLASSYGEEPSEEVKSLMSEKYGFDL